MVEVQRKEAEHLPEPAQRIRRLWLVRHGATEWNQQKRFFGHGDIGLSAVGVAQAEWVARRLQREDIACVYSSDLPRAQQTAEIIVRQRLQPLTVRYSADWREISFGDWEGLVYEQIAEKYPQDLEFFNDPLHYSPTNGETFADLLQRVQSAFVELTRTVSTETGDLLLISHGGVLRALLCYLLRIPYEQQWRLKIAHGSISALDFIPASIDPVETVMLSLLNIQMP